MPSISAEFCRRLGCSIYVKDQALYLAWADLSDIQAVSSKAHLAKLFAASLGVSQVHLCTQAVGEKKPDVAYREFWKVEFSFIRRQEKWYALGADQPRH